VNDRYTLFACLSIVRIEVEKSRPGALPPGRFSF
jgi:hypothetical protein